MIIITVQDIISPMKIDNDFFAIDKISSGISAKYALPTDKAVRKGTLKDGVYYTTEYKFRMKPPGYIAGFALMASAYFAISKVLFK